MPRDSSVPETRPPSTSNFLSDWELYRMSDRQITLHYFAWATGEIETHMSFQHCSSLAHPAQSVQNAVTLSYKLCFSCTVS